MPARLRSPAGWGDARILNVSSRGMLVHTPQEIAVGSVIELRRGQQAFVAQVMWKKGTRAGLQADSVLPLTEIMCMSENVQSGDCNAQCASTTRALSFDPAYFRAHGRLFELAVMTLIACIIAVGTTVMMGDVIRGPLQGVAMVLGR